MTLGGQFGPLWLLGFGLACVGFVRLFRALSMPEPSQPAAPPPVGDPDDLENRMDLWPRVVGKACAVCQKNVFSYVDGALCGVCDQPMHRKCVSAHGTHAATPYR
jgi:hypothetical protein